MFLLERLLEIAEYIGKLLLGGFILFGGFAIVVVIIDWFIDWFIDWLKGGK